jgi:catechol 2,3-dioxygenase
MSTLRVDHPSETSIHPDTSMGAVRLTVSDLDRSRDFYERAIGLTASERDDGAVELSAGDRSPLVELHWDPSAAPRDHRAPGLFHLAILVPSRVDLAFALARIAEARTALDGASDHLVSEALYLSDPDGNGIEIYRDRPREEWRYRDGALEMATLPLDLDSVLSELGGAAELQPKAPLGARMGHVHLQVADVAEAERFYSGVLGFDVTVRGYPGALFVSAGGYHHHLGLNTWRSAGSPPAAPGAIGLRSFEIVLPTSAELDRVLERARVHGIEVEAGRDGSYIRDPFGNRVLLRAAPQRSNEH